MSTKHDFDFWFGMWVTENKRLKKRLQGCTEWETFQAVCTAVPILGGMGNIDDFIAQDWKPDYIGMTLRLFNPSTKQWSLYWASNQTSVGTLEPPVIGAFKDGVGIFECDDIQEGQAVRVRFTWSEITANSAKWEQAFSTDNGATWEINWVMQHTRKETL